VARAEAAWLEALLPTNAWMAPSMTALSRMNGRLVRRAPRRLCPRSSHGNPLLAGEVFCDIAPLDEAIHRATALSAGDRLPMGVWTCAAHIRPTK